jgi:hypothetical protein
MNLQNNSNEMKTVVETFVIEETAELIFDNEQLEKWNAHVIELGLTGQTKIVSKDKSPIPFMHLKESLLNVFRTLCPRIVSVEEYNISPIPVEILDLIALSKNEKYFKVIEIWYDDKNPDPVCIGVTGYYYEPYWCGGANQELKNEKFETKEDAINAGAKHTTFSSGERYLLGKWADVKHSFEELKEMATKRFISEEGNQYRKQIKDAQRGLDDLEITAFEKFN